MKTHGELEDWSNSPTTLDLGTRWRWVFRFKPWRFTPRQRALNTLRLGDWVGFSGFTLCSTKKCIFPTRNPIPALQPVAHLYKGWAIPDPEYVQYINWFIRSCSFKDNKCENTNTAVTSVRWTATDNIYDLPVCAVNCYRKLYIRTS
jgi:hypothetical protein